MLPVIIRSVGDVEMPHELLKVPQRCFAKQMEVRGHQHIGQNFGLINVAGPLQKIKKYFPVGIIREDLLARIPAAGHVVISILKLDAEGPRHQLHFYQKDKAKSRIKI